MTNMQYIIDKQFWSSIFVKEKEKETDKNP